MIEFDNVTRTYGRKVAVDRLALSIEPGELFALLGPNGAGKTTTIKMLVGLLRPDSGTVTIGGHDVAEQTRQASKLMGYVPDQPFLYDKLTGREFLEFVGEMRGLKRQTIDARIVRESGNFQLDEFLDDLIETYSHGMKQRMVFASAFLHDPAVLVIDEPMVGLDPLGVRLVKDLLRSRAAAGTSVVMSTHTLAVAEEIADRIGIMNAGRVHFLGTVPQLREKLSSHHEALEPLFLELTGDGNGRATAPNAQRAPTAAGRTSAP